MDVVEMERLRQSTLPPVVVPAALSELHGPETGIVHLPVFLDWSNTNAYDLSNPRRVQSLYEVVLREAKAVPDLSEHLNPATLVRVWQDLRLPARVRAAWESSFPDLAAAHA